MAISVTNSLSIRLFYKENKALITSSGRKESTTGTLSFADASALRTGIRRLQGYKFEDSSEEATQQKLQAFVDTYNLTLDSGTSYSTNDTAVKNAVKKMKNLTSENEDALKKIGVSIDKSSGKMHLSSSAAENLKSTRFSNFFTKDNEYLEEMYSAAKHIVKHVDVQL